MNNQKKGTITRYYIGIYGNEMCLTLRIKGETGKDYNFAKSVKKEQFGEWLYYFLKCIGISSVNELTNTKVSLTVYSGAVVDVSKAVKSTEPSELDLNEIFANA